MGTMAPGAIFMAVVTSCARSGQHAHREGFPKTCRGGHDPPSPTSVISMSLFWYGAVGPISAHMTRHPGRLHLISGPTRRSCTAGPAVLESTAVLRSLEGGTMRGLLLLAACAASFFVAAGTAQAAVIDNESIDFTGFQVEIPCANGGTGDIVTFTGQLHVLITFTESGTHVSGVEHFQPQHLSGTDSAGHVYHGVGITRDSFAGNFTNGQFIETFVNNFYMVGTGTAPSYRVHETFHITFNANGDVTASVDHLRITCG